MRGRTLNHSFVILDEAQNTTPEQMKMFLTRIGFGSKAVVTGDITQIDLARGQKSGLVEAQEVLKKVRGIAFTHFGAEDVVRHPLVQRIVNAYENQQARNARTAQRRERAPCSSTLTVQYATRARGLPTRGRAAPLGARGARAARRARASRCASSAARKARALNRDLPRPGLRDQRPHLRAARRGPPSRATSRCARRWSRARRARRARAWPRTTRTSSCTACCTCRATTTRPRAPKRARMEALRDARSSKRLGFPDPYAAHGLR